MCVLYTLIVAIIQCKQTAASSHPSSSLLSWSQKAWMLLQSVSLFRGLVALSEI